LDTDTLKIVTIFNDRFSLYLKWKAGLVFR